MPAIGVAAVLSIAMKTVPLGSFVFPTAWNENCAPLSIVTPLAMRVALAAVELPKSKVEPGAIALPMLPLAVKTPLAAVELSKN